VLAARGLGASRPSSLGARGAWSLEAAQAPRWGRGAGRLQPPWPNEISERERKMVPVLERLQCSPSLPIITDTQVSAPRKRSGPADWPLLVPRGRGHGRFMP
jgi:hypothetical protein